MSAPEQMAFSAHRSIAALVDDLLEDRLMGGFWTLSAEQKAVLRILRHHTGAHFPCPLSILTREVSSSERSVKATVKCLVEDFGVPIGASREAPYGYFLCVTPEDVRAAIRPLANEIASLARRVRALGGQKMVEEIRGQMALPEPE